MTKGVDILSLLMEVQEWVKTIAEAISSAVKVDVDIVDDELIRVAATSKENRVRVGTKLVEGGIFTKLIKTGEVEIIKKAQNNRYCKKCTRKECTFRAGIFYPIRFRGKVIGAISLETSDHESEKYLCSNILSFDAFLKNMSEMISSRIHEDILHKELTQFAQTINEIINLVHEGIIATNKDGIVIRFNDSAEHILGLDKNLIIGQSINNIFPYKYILNEIISGKKFLSREITCQIGKKKHQIICTAKPIQTNNVLTGIVLSFIRLSDAKTMTKDFSGSQKTISFNDILGKNHSLNKVKEMAMRITNSNSTVLITGESGTGKELLAKAIHYSGKRCEKPFIAVNCGAIPENLLESELFGYDDGAFTGARKGGKPGKFEAAQGGTIFLDEIGNMAPYLQAKLLRVLQEKKVERIGCNVSKEVDVRVIAATHADLWAMIKEDKFREDLFYRLNVIPLHIPPLRDYIEDIPVLLEHYIRKYSVLLEKDIIGLAPETLRLLTSYNWPGNVRELINVVEYAINMEDDNYIKTDNLPEYLREKCSNKKVGSTPLEEYEKELITTTLGRYGNTVRGKEMTAVFLGWSMATLYRKIKKYGI